LAHDDALASLLAPALGVAGARLEVVAVEPKLPAGCAPRAATASGVIEASARVAVRLDGRGCPAWVWARVEVFAPLLVTTRPVRAGEPLGPAVKRVQRRLFAPGALVEIAPGAVAARALAAGVGLQTSDAAAPGLPTGSAVKVVIRAGALTVEQAGTIVPCARDSVCAVLPSGKHVAGHLVEGHLDVELQ
jgi:flagella basal body P-ring formation protein FlgA